MEGKIGGEFIADIRCNAYFCLNFKLNNMNEILNKIQEAYAAFHEDSTLQCEKNNKAAGQRARKASLEIEKLMKEFRKASLDASKK